MDTALRETEEEIGVEREAIKVWGPLDAVVTGTGYLVWPFGGFVDHDVSLVPDSAEVADVMRMPLDVIVNPKCRRTITRLDSPREREFGAYSYDGKIIWGATARMLSQVGKTLELAAAETPGREATGQGIKGIAGGNGD